MVRTIEDFITSAAALAASGNNGDKVAAADNAMQSVANNQDSIVIGRMSPDGNNYTVFPLCVEIIDIKRYIGSDHEGWNPSGPSRRYRYNEIRSEIVERI